MYAVIIERSEPGITRDPEVYVFNSLAEAEAFVERMDPDYIEDIRVAKVLPSLTPPA